jgi:conjugative relaxase-like TrwC/TraI family protein
MPGSKDSSGYERGAHRVLILAKITRSSAGGYAEYLEGKAQAPELGDYYLKDGERTEAPGRWAQGAGQFGIDAAQPVSGDQLHALMDVRRPDTGEELRRVGGSGEAVDALDATFSAPKSVSAAWALAGAELREQIEQAHEVAVDRALDYAARQVPMLRRRVSQDTVVHEKATGVIATSWRHTTARAVEDQVPDPQLHSHVLLHGAVRRDGRIVAIDSRAWLVHQREVGAAYRTELAHELVGLGFAVRRGTGRGGRYFELDGVPQGLLDRWSSRHHQVHAAIRQRLADREGELQAVIDEGGPAAADAVSELELLRQTGQLSPAQERLMGTVTRSDKVAVTVADLDEEWRRTAVGIALSRERVELLRHRQVAIASLSAAVPHEVLDALTEFDATFPAREARAVALERSAGAPIDAALDRLRELRASEEILVLADGSGTTRKHRGRERTVVQVAERLAAARLDPLPAASAAQESDRLDRELAIVGGRLSEEQRAAIALACGSRALVVIEGQAGTGKSTTLTGIARAHQASGRHILVTSTAALSAERLGAELGEGGVECEAYSTAALDAAIRHGRVSLTPQTTIIHDEAALASTREQLDLLDAVETSGARLIAVGDPQQNQPVGAGGLWDHIENTARAAEAHVELTHNQRARAAADRRDQALFRQGHAERAIRGYAAREHIHFHDDPRRAEDQALDAAQADRIEGKTTTVTAQTSNEHLDALNARAQAIRRQAGELGHDSLPLAGRPYELHEGDLVQARRTLQHPEHGVLRNGTPGVVAAVDPDARTLDLRLDKATVITLSEEQAAEADLRLAYVQHPFPAQGQTADTVHLIIGEHATREGSYVGLTRAREVTDIYIAASLDRNPDGDRLQALAEHMTRTEPDLPSIRTPLRHEFAVAAEAETSVSGDRRGQARSDVVADREPEKLRRTSNQTGELAYPHSSTDGFSEDVSHTSEFALDQSNEVNSLAAEPPLAADLHEAEELQEHRPRMWPGESSRELSARRDAVEQLERDDTIGWDP